LAALGRWRIDWVRAITLPHPLDFRRPRVDNGLSSSNDHRKEHPVGIGGLLGLVILVLDVYAIYNVYQSKAANATKLLWTVIIIVLPVLGLIAWFFIGPKK
jgi:hypothetical protein